MQLTDLNEEALHAATLKAKELTEQMSNGVAVPYKAVRYITEQSVLAYEQAKEAYAEGV